MCIQKFLGWSLIKSYSNTGILSETIIKPFLKTGIISETLIKSFLNTGLLYERYVSRASGCFLLWMPSTNASVLISHRYPIHAQSLTLISMKQILQALPRCLSPEHWKVYLYLWVYEEGNKTRHYIPVFMFERGIYWDPR